MLDIQVREGGGRRTRSGRLGVGAVTLGIFTVMTAELLPVGLLTPVAADLGVSTGTAGLTVTVPGLVAAVSAPLIATRAAGADRRTVLVLLMALVAAANLGTALANHMAAVLGARALLGVAIGGFWALAGGLAPRLVPAAGVGRATAVIFGGVSAAAVLGVPAATVAAERAGWRGAFAAVGVMAVLATGALAALLPALPGAAGGPGRGGGVATLLRLPRRDARVRVGLLLTLLLVTGHFLAYSFVRPVLTEHAHVPERFVGLLLLGHGIAGVAGNFLAGPRAARSPLRTLAALGAGLAVALTALALAGGAPPAGAALLILWGLAYGGVSVGLQSFFMAVAAPEDVETATGLYVSVFCLSIALGALLGGLVTDATTFTVVLATGAALTLAACLTAALSGRNPTS
ncbi:MFS transporter [Streptomyces sp. NPDC090127]|uniref:MFS transporter n=1 Tax=Streptomyces sp. NPDC090127 TaxID=3365953 RepID=UPI0038297A7F